MKKNGFVAISTVLIIGVVVLAITLMVSLTSIGEMQQGLAMFRGEDNLVSVEGCVEDALLKVRGDIAYNGGTITRPEGTCSVTVSKIGTTWTMDVTTTDIKYQRVMRVIFERNPTGIVLTSWKEI